MGNARSKKRTRLAICVGSFWIVSVVGVFVGFLAYPSYVESRFQDLLAIYDIFEI